MHVRMLCHGPGRNEKAGAGLYGPGKGRHTGGIKDSSIPTAHCQYDYHHIIYDYRACRMLDSGEPVPEGYKTMADGGSFPCAIYMLLEYFKVPTDLITIGKTLVQYGYRTENSGTLWICMDNLLEKHWGIKTKIQDSIFELCESVSLDSPVVALVPAEWLHSYPMPSNECLIIWRLEEKTAVVSTTSGHQPVKIGLYDLLAHIKRAWQCSIN